MAGLLCKNFSLFGYILWMETILCSMSKMWNQAHLRIVYHNIQLDLGPLNHKGYMTSSVGEVKDIVLALILNHTKESYVLKTLVYLHADNLD